MAHRAPGLFPQRRRFVSHVPETQPTRFTCSRSAGANAESTGIAGDAIGFHLLPRAHWPRHTRYRGVSRTGALAIARFAVADANGAAGRSAQHAARRGDGSTGGSFDTVCGNRADRRANAGERRSRHWRHAQCMDKRSDAMPEAGAAGKGECCGEHDAKRGRELHRKCGGQCGEVEAALPVPPHRFVTGRMNGPRLGLARPVDGARATPRSSAPGCRARRPCR